MPDHILFIELAIAIISAVGVGVGTYAAIKSDLTKAIITAESARDSAATAHRRIDDHINVAH